MYETADACKQKRICYTRTNVSVGSFGIESIIYLLFSGTKAISAPKRRCLEQKPNKKHRKIYI